MCNHNDYQRFTHRIFAEYLHYFFVSTWNVQLLNKNKLIKFSATNLHYLTNGGGKCKIMYNFAINFHDGNQYNRNNQFIA